MAISVSEAPLRRRKTLKACAWCGQEALMLAFQVYCGKECRRLSSIQKVIHNKRERSQFRMEQWEFGRRMDALKKEIKRELQVKSVGAPGVGRLLRQVHELKSDFERANRARLERQARELEAAKARFAKEAQALIEELGGGVPYPEIARVTLEEIALPEDSR